MLMRNAKKHFPLKIIKAFYSNPWFDRSIRRMVRKKQRLYNLAKQKNTAEACNNFKNFRRLTKQCINHARNNYISSILSDNMTENPKKFGKYVKSQRQDSVGIPTLTAQGRHCSSNFGKASILNEFFQSVFTKENVDDMPETAPFPLLQWAIL